jgi:hypothetical protein
VRRSSGLSRDQDSDSLCGRQSSPGGHTGWNMGRAYVAWWQSCSGSMYNRRRADARRRARNQIGQDEDTQPESSWWEDGLIGT